MFMNAGPAIRLAPTSPAEAAGFVRRVVADGLPVVIEGSGSRITWAPSPPPAWASLCTAGLDEPGEVRSENLTATFSAGTPLSAVHDQLRRLDLWLPLEHVDGPHSTLGGCLAAGFTNPLRWSRGTPRDWVLGLEVVDTAGRLLSFGGEVIKNVAGYDMVRIHVGAWGRLGLITRATLRLLPLPESEATVVATFASPMEAALALRTAARHPAGAATLEVLAPPRGVDVMVRLMGEAARVESRGAGLCEALSSGEARAVPTAVELHQGAAGRRVWEAYARQRADLAEHYAWRLKLALPAPGLEEALALSAQVFADRDWALAGQGGNGVYSVFWQDERGPLPALEAARARAGSRAFVIAEGRAAQAVAGTPGWESFPPRAGRDQDRLERGLLAALAPGRIFNPHLYGETTVARGSAR